jgi:hypothetical protein
LWLRHSYLIAGNNRWKNSKANSHKEIQRYERQHRPLGGAALGLAGMASASTTVTDHSTGTSIVTSPNTYAHPAPNALPGWRHHHGHGHLAMFNQ